MTVTCVYYFRDPPPATVRDGGHHRHSRVPPSPTKRAVPRNNNKRNNKRDTINNILRRKHYVDKHTLKYYTNDDRSRSVGCGGRQTRLAVTATDREKPSSSASLRLTDAIVTAASGIENIIILLFPRRRIRAVRLWTRIESRNNASKRHIM